MSVLVGDFQVECLAQILPRIIQLRNRWGRNGERDEETAKSVARAFLTEVEGITFPTIDNGFILHITIHCYQKDGQAKSITARLIQGHFLK